MMDIIKLTVEITNMVVTLLLHFIINNHYFFLIYQYFSLFTYKLCQ